MPYTSESHSHLLTFEIGFSLTLLAGSGLTSAPLDMCESHTQSDREKGKKNFLKTPYFERIRKWRQRKKSSQLDFKIH